jgi:CRISPR/Cas system endoribonuclease Cas6 (RAMP superfamily)
MPRSLVLYTSRDIYWLFEETLADTFREYPSAPYTLSFAQKTQADIVRVRTTNISDEGIVGAIVDELVETKRAVLASDSEPDVQNATYKDLQENADRSSREIRLQFTSPTLLKMGSYEVQFPVVPLLFRHYMGAWNAFSPDKITFEPALLEHIRLTDFKISSEKSRFGLAFQGWIDLEIARGRTENEIAIINMLCDYSLYCGTGVHAESGLGQTRRAPRERH